MNIFDTFVYKNGEIVDVGFVKWVHSGVPDEEGKEREKRREDWARMGHCKPCTALSGCYFEIKFAQEKSRRRRIITSALRLSIAKPC